MKNTLNKCKSKMLWMLVGIIVILFSITPYINAIEEQLGLPFLFKLRGPAHPPTDIVIVSIDKLSARILRLPDDPEKWPRTYYAQLINKINQQKPAIIAFNMTFDEPREPANDQSFADAMTQGNNIILSNYLKRNAIQTPGSIIEYEIEQVIEPLPLFELSALGSAPFPLPKTASTVKQFWTYKNSAGDIATFPVAIFQCFLFNQAYDEIAALLHQLNSPYNFQLPTTFEQLVNRKNVLESIQKVQSILSNNYALLEKLDALIQAGNFSAKKTRLLNAWMALLNAPNSLYFNHYGHTGTIVSIPFYQALVSDILNPALFSDKIVLIGYSENIEPEKSQGLYTVFSDSNNETSSPIDLAATAIANLIDNCWIKPIQPFYQFLLLIGWSLLLMTLFRLLSFKLAIGIITGLSITYLSLAHISFTHYFIWLPVFIPIVLIFPALLLIKSISNYNEGRQNQQKLQQAFSLYLPDDVVNTITQTQDMNRYGEFMQGICMATDAGQYTTLSENMDPQVLNDLINRYYGVMFPLVKKHHGMISDVTGDAMFAVWPRAGYEKKDRINACQAALNISQSIQQFNLSQPYQLPTRLGLHFGDIRLGNVGAVDHYEYRAVGNTVNTATRIEGLNKALGTQILVSAQVINEIDRFITREIGHFILKGKTNPVHIYELITAIPDQITPAAWHILDNFREALLLFQQQKWQEALTIWNSIEQSCPGDGPTRFYINYISQNIDFHLNQEQNKQTSIIKIGNITTILAFKDIRSIE